MSAPQVRVSTHQKHMVECENRKQEDEAAALRVGQGIQACGPL